MISVCFYWFWMMPKKSRFTTTPLQVEVVVGDEQWSFPLPAAVTPKPPLCWAVPF